ncbi:porphobilinogen synthase [Peptostreptococcus stomatis DSM 17678]|uniref:Delta-aminolevulinic acid dehydratase n=1 Tax=Peptostreptococcus stomatis DSM 17678 TaxID=596315 RepID=E0E4W4_9FIRM|nr:porphobilinogen synthase [Peptostreptococcus stomatis]EFM64077.1 porphobilinogen synthase [Peptostreptococcus stomatis DSM 17678]
MIRRPRRLRVNSITRDLVRETRLDMKSLVYPLFIVEGEKIKNEIKSMPGVYHFSIDMLDGEIEDIIKHGIQNIMIFGVTHDKDACASSGFAEDGIVQRAVRKIKSLGKSLNVITDVCMCEYTDHGHCGILDETGYVDNDKSLAVLAKIALSHAQAGADMVAPSDMMDGRVGAIRKILDEHGFVNVGIMAYSAKFASNFYGPFRDAADSAPAFGDRKTYQMDPANFREAMLECAYDIEEGADMVMVKPALSYLDVIKGARERFDVPIVAYNVSGEYSMIKFAISQGLLNEEVMYEAVMSIKRAGADIIITYFAKDLAKYIGRY